MNRFCRKWSNVDLSLGEIVPGNSHLGLLPIKERWDYFFLGSFHNEILFNMKLQIFYHSRPFNRILIFWDDLFVFKHVRHLAHQKNILYALPKFTVFWAFHPLHVVFSHFSTTICHSALPFWNIHKYKLLQVHSLSYFLY